MVDLLNSETIATTIIVAAPDNARPSRNDRVGTVDIQFKNWAMSGISVSSHWISKFDRQYPA